MHRWVLAIRRVIHTVTATSTQLAMRRPLCAQSEDWSAKMIAVLIAPGPVKRRYGKRHDGYVGLFFSLLCFLGCGLASAQLGPETWKWRGA